MFDFNFSIYEDKAGSDFLAYINFNSLFGGNPTVNLKDIDEKNDKFRDLDQLLLNDSKDPMKKIAFYKVSEDKGDVLEQLRNIGGSILKEIKKNKGETLSIFLDEKLHGEKFFKALGEGIILGSFTFDKYLSKSEELKLQSIFLGTLEKAEEDSFNEGVLLGEFTNISRLLGNEPGSLVTPDYLGKIALDLGEKNGFNVEIKKEDEIKALEMNAFLAVAKGSSYAPRLIVMEYLGGGDETIALVGKGITFDTGGLSLKPSGSMLTMQGDMIGGGSVIAAMAAISKMKIKKNVVGIVAACDNSLSDRSYLPNDIIISRSGKSIFVSNTDAEGRLTLIDAIDYAITEKKADRVVDIATLTGAAEVALGQKIAPVITNNDNFFKELKMASKVSGERVWELPHDEDFMELIKSPYADLDNSGGRYAGAITAGMFLKSVVPNKIPWLHIDIAGPSWSEENKGYFSKGATGFGTRLLYELIKGAVN